MEYHFNGRKSNDNKFINSSYPNAKPPIYVDIGWEFTRVGQRIDYKIIADVLPRDNQFQGYAIPIYAGLTISGVTRVEKICDSLPLANWNQAYNYEFRGSVQNNTGEPISFKMEFFCTSHIGNYNDAGDYANRSRTFSLTKETPSPASSVTLINSDPTGAIFKVDNLSSANTCTVKIGDKYLTSGGLSTTATQLPSFTSYPITDSSFFSADSYSKTLPLEVRTFQNGTAIERINSTITFNLPKENSRPTLASNVVDENETTKTLTGDNHKIILNASRMRCNANVTGAYGATIVSTKVKIKSASESYAIPHTFKYPTEPNIIYIVTDSRGGVYEYPVTVNSIPYNAPTLTASVARAGSEDIIQATIGGNFTNTSFGSVQNTIKLRYKKRELDGAWPEAWTLLTAVESGSSYSFGGVIEDFPYKYEYEVMFSAYDKLRSVQTDAIYVPKAIPIADWGKDDFHFHVPVNISTDSEAPLIINNVNIWEWMQRVQEAIWPPTPPAPDVPTTPTEYTNVSVPAGETVTFGPYDFKPVKAIISSRSYKNQIYTQDANTVCGVSNMLLRFLDDKVTLNNRSGTTWSPLEKVEIYFQ